MSWLGAHSRAIAPAPNLKPSSADHNALEQRYRTGADVRASKLDLR
jgi:hypothetical protein